MYFNIVSDLHLEFGDCRLPGGDVLLLSGDIGLAIDPFSYLDILERYCKDYNKVFMVMGNHEHYHGDFNTSYQDIINATEHLENYTLLNNSTVELEEDILLVGATLWSDIDPLHAFEISRGMNDYHIIKNFSTTIAVEEFNKSRTFIENTLKENLHKKVIVMTHHAPSLQVPEIYRNNILNSAYGSDLESLIKEHKPNVWVHGHTHVSREYMIGDTQVLCNPRGYAGRDVNYKFDAKLTIKV